jgi:putative hydrolase of the HAD superfamily
MDAIILDVGGVFLVPHFQTVNPALEPFGATLDLAGAERAHYFGIRELERDADGDDDVRSPYLSGYTAAAGVPEAMRQAASERILEAWAQPNLDVWRQHVRGSRDGLLRLAARGLKLGIISNSDGTVEEQLRRTEICQVGEGVGVPVLAIVDSGVVGVSKPAVEIFRHALEPLAVTPDQALYVGDTVRYDVRGARAAGLLPVHFDPYSLCLTPADHAHIKALAEVESFV